MFLLSGFSPVCQIWRGIPDAADSRHSSRNTPARATSLSCPLDFSVGKSSTGMSRRRHDARRLSYFQPSILVSADTWLYVRSCPLANASRASRIDAMPEMNAPVFTAAGAGSVAMMRVVTGCPALSRVAVMIFVPALSTTCML